MKEESKKIPKYGTIEWGIYQYEQQKKSMRGHNYRYFNEKWWKEMEDKGWKMHQFTQKRQIDQWSTPSELYAKEEVQKLREMGMYARIIAGYHKTVQRTKHFTVIYKPKTIKQVKNKYGPDHYPDEK